MSTVTFPFTFQLTGPFHLPLYAGTAIASSSDVPGVWPVALDGRTYLVDTEVDKTFTDYWNHESIPLIRTQADPSSFPKESSLNPQGLWRRFQDSAHHGAGQAYLDRDDEADPYRFSESLGVYVWDRYKLSLLNDVDEKRNSANTNLDIVTAGARIYVADGQTLAYTADITPGTPTFTTVTGTHASTITCLTSDGTTIYAGWSNGIGKTDTSTSAITTAWNALVPTVMEYVKGRLMAAETNSIYNVTASGAAPTALFDHPNTSFLWVGFAEGVGHIYAAGYSGDKSLIYRIAVKPDASSLDQPIIAGELPDGEIIRSIGGYLGFIVLGTDKGWRFCDIDSQGNLVIGLLVTTPAAVLCFEPQDRFIWYGLSNYDASHTGLGRMDITTFTQPLTPAYASDLMVSGQGAVLAVASFQNLRVFAVSGDGFYAQDTTKVASGTIESGLISWGLPDQKTSLYLDVRTEPLVGSVTASLAVDNGSYTALGTFDTAAETGYQFTTSQAQGQHMEVKLTLMRDATATTTGPVVERWTLKAFPALGDEAAAETHQVPLMLYRNLAPWGVEKTVDVVAEIEFIKELRQSRRVVVLQELTESYTGFVDDYRWVPHNLAHENGIWQMDGTMVIIFKRIQ